MMINCDKHNWTHTTAGNFSVYYVGRYSSIRKILDFLSNNHIHDQYDLSKIVNNIPGNFSLVAESEVAIIALVDRVSGFDVFYKDTSNSILISNSARKLFENNHTKDVPDKISLLEMKMSGYVSGNRTIYSSIKKLNAGELLLYKKNSKEIILHSYFEYYPIKTRYEKNSLLIEELDEKTDIIIKRNIHDANGSTIWVPLSGGLDSRLIICKLVQHGYDNIRTYSYGVVGNYDSLRAKNIAHVLKIRWDFIPTSPIEARKYFLSKERKEYWDFASGLYIVPNLHGMFALRSLVKSGEMKRGDVVINGQSGDFIAGQHIPIMNPSQASNNELLNHILSKHFSHRGQYTIDDYEGSLVKKNIQKSLGVYRNISNYQEFAQSYEYWEWKERQAKRVINGQANYDFLGLNWELPLWDIEYLNFWVNLPLHQKINRSLFVEYVHKMNFYGLFNSNFFMSRWPRQRILIQFIGNIMKRSVGSSISDNFYKRMDWYSQYQYLYALTGRDEYNRKWHKYNGEIPYMTDVWLNENIKGSI